ncbi:MAG: glutathione peroxidase, partial [Chromatiales bacterium]
NLCEAYAGKVVLVVNTASKCGFTPQYEGLEALYRDRKADGLVVLGFPSNDFRQEYSDEQKIQDFCRLTYSVQFPMFETTRVREGGADPLYRTLAGLAGEYPRWNFHKYLIGRDGRLVGSYPSQTRPDDPDLVEAIERLIEERGS